MAGEKVVDALELSQVPQLQRSNPNVQNSQFPTLLGEMPVLLSKTVDGTAMITNFRFCVCERRSFINVPLMSIGELVVVDATKRMRIGCKDGSTYSCTFATVEDCRICTDMLRDKVGLPQNLQHLFAFAFFTHAELKGRSGVKSTPSELEQIALCAPVSEAFAYSFGKEVERLGFDTSRRRIWRMSHANDNYEFCPTYPKLHILPATVDDDKLKRSLDFRALKRFPSVVWRDQSSGVVLIRSSQPLSSFLGVSYFSSPEDVLLVEEIVNACNKDRDVILSEERRRSQHDPEAREMNSGRSHGQGDSHVTAEEDGAQGSLVSDACSVSNGHGASNGSCENDVDSSPRKLAIVDCRSLAGVWGNSFKGGGTEDEVAYKCNIIHLDLANIHAVRDSFNKLRNLCHSYPEGTYHKALSSSMWLTYISALLRGANIVVELMKVKQRPVLVHCSDGWDRTSQICSLSELMMDPYFRTIEGFQVLVEREWLHFGHKFAERGGHDPKCSDTNQISPIFLQFLDCVHQLTLQYPAEFEFNEAYLVKLLRHSQACLFGTFLHNCPRERERCPQPSASVWTLLQPGNRMFKNLLCKPKLQVLTARFSEHDVALWKSVYMDGHRYQADFFPESLLTDGGPEAKSCNTVAEGIPRSRSMDDLSHNNTDSGRRSSDPSLTQGQESAAAGIHDTSSSSAELLHYPDELTPTASRNVGSQSEDIVAKDTACSPRKVLFSPAAKNKNSGPVPESRPLVVGNETRASVEAISADGQDATSVISGEKESSPPVGHCTKENLCVGEGMEDQCVKVSQVAENDGSILQSRSGGEVLELILSSGKGREDLSEELSKGLSVELSLGRTRNSSSTSSTSKKSDDSGDTITRSPQKVARGDAGGSFSLLAERLAEVEEAGDEFKSREIVSEDYQHSIHDGSSTAAIPTSGPVTRGDSHPEASLSSSTVTFTTTTTVCLPSTHCSVSSNGVRGRPSAGNVLPSPSGAAELQVNGGANIYVNSVSTETLTEHPETSTVTDSAASVSPNYSKQLDVGTDRLAAPSPPLSSSSSSSVSLSSPMKKDGQWDIGDTGTGTNLLSRRVRAASGASRDLSVSPSMGNWTDTGRLRHTSGSESAFRRCIRSTVSTSTSDISDSNVVQLSAPSCERQPSVRQHIDVDGLTLFCEERQELLSELLQSKENKVQDLEYRLAKVTEMIRKSRHMAQAPQPSGLEDLLMSDTESGEPSSLGATSNPSLDSWEPLDETEAKVMPWVPDHTVTHCASCDGAFWFARWRHHCRNCGKVFCDECSNYRAPVPHAHLNKPERVCRSCHSILLQLSPGASSDGRIPTLVADG